MGRLCRPKKLHDSCHAKARVITCPGVYVRVICSKQKLVLFFPDVGTFCIYSEVPMFRQISLGFSPKYYLANQSLAMFF